METIALPDGRRLDVRVSGPANGFPLFFHHGTPGAAVPARALERAVHARGWRLVTMSRPGYGSSTRSPGRSVVDVVADTEAVASSLEIDKCLMAGWSGGGPHALACAALMPSVQAVLTIAGVGPADAAGLDFLAGMGQENVDEFGAAFAGEASLRAHLDAQRPGLLAVTGADLASVMSTLLADVDRAAVTAEYGEDLAMSFREGLDPGVDGWLDDDLAFVKPWGFEPEQVHVPAYVWHGASDLMVPFAHGKWLAAHLPTARAHLLADHGHLSIALGALDPMLDGLQAHV